MAKDLSSELSKGRYDLVISDHKMPGFDAIQALDIFKQSGIDAPFIIYSDVMGEEEAAEAMRKGANDYVLKRNPHRLQSSCRETPSCTSNRAKPPGTTQAR